MTLCPIMFLPQVKGVHHLCHLYLPGRCPDSIRRLSPGLCAPLCVGVADHCFFMKEVSHHWDFLSDTSGALTIALVLGWQHILGCYSHKSHLHHVCRHECDM